MPEDKNTKRVPSWETVASLGIVVAGATTVLIAAPQRMWDVVATFDAATWVGISTAFVGLVGLIFGRAIMRKEDK